MPPRRYTYAERVAALAGPAVLTLDDRASGWPSLARVHAAGGDVAVDMFVGGVDLTHRGRDAVERRVQNPGQNSPVVVTPGRVPVVVGVWEADAGGLTIPRPLLVVVDATGRAGRSTRQSIFLPVAGLLVAGQKGWYRGPNAVGDLVTIIDPSLLAGVVAAMADNVELPGDLVRAAVEGSGLLDEPPGDAPAAERARRAVTTLARDARFGQRVRAAYDGRCAVCGLGVTVAQGAHVYPASAPGSADEPWNGLALCPNHHAVFDRHLMAVVGPSWTVLFHPDLVTEAVSDPATAALVAAHGTPVRKPDPDTTAKTATMLTKRYAHFDGRYNWLPA